LSKSFVETITEFFKPQAPLWACELTSKHVIVASVNSYRTRIAETFGAELPAGGNLDAARPILQQLLSQVGFKGSEIAVVVPDETARIAFLTAEHPSKNAEEQQSFIRWKLKKSIPFDVDTAQVAYRILGPHRGGTGVDILVALSPRSKVQEYEALFDSLDIHAGIVLPSTVAALNLLTTVTGDTLFVKIAPDCITTTVFQNRRIQFYRRVTDVSLYDAVYPTVLYYQDKLGGQTFERLCVCGYDENLQPSLDEIQEKLGLTPQRMEPKSVEDIYKPALGAVHLRPEAVV
jgi:type IV pilus assembly protein PilM